MLRGPNFEGFISSMAFIPFAEIKQHWSDA